MTTDNSVIVDAGEAKFVYNFMQRIHAAINADLSDPEKDMTESQMKRLKDYRYALHQVMRFMKGNRGSYRDIQPEDLEDFLLIADSGDKEVIFESTLNYLERDIDNLVSLGYVVNAYRVVPDTGNRVAVYDGI